MATGKPWWRLTKTTRQGFVLGVFWTIWGLAELYLALNIRGRGVTLFVAVVSLVLGIGYFASAAAMVRRERSRFDD
jgi:hypothetical protein